MTRYRCAWARAIGVAGLVLALAATLIAPAGAHSASREERRLQQVRAQIEQVRAAKDTQAASLAEAEQQVAAVMAAVAAAEAAVQRQRQAVEEARGRVTELTAQVSHRRHVMRERAVSLYRQGSSVPLAAVWAADSPEDAMRRAVMAEVVQRSDRKVLEGTSIAQVAVDAQREELEYEEQVLARVVEEERAVLAEVEALRNERATVLAATNTQLGQLESHAQHLEAERRQVEAMSRRASRARPSRDAAGPPAVGAGGWVWPARGPVTSGYGPRWGRMHEGIDIGAPSGSAVYAARAGRVASSGRMGGYGLLTLVDHGGGIVTAYAHQSAVSVRSGQQVGAGQRIGSVGCTGSCTGPHLHFEVRVNGSARNPRSYLP